LFQVFFKHGFSTKHPISDFASIFLEELQTLLTTYNEDLLKVVSISGQEAPLHYCSIQPSPLAFDDNVPSYACMALVVPDGGPPPSSVASKAAAESAREQNPDYFCQPLPALANDLCRPPGTKTNVCTL
jgi:hypothetical protein